MRLPALAIDNRAFTWMIVIFLTILGMRAYMTMPRTENPEVSVPGSSVIVIMPGAGPVDMEKMVALPLEEVLNGLEDIERISSEVRDGIAIIGIEFESDADPDEKYDEVVQQVNNIRSTLPDEIVKLDLWQWSITDMSMMQLALVSDSEPYSELEAHAEILKKRVEKIRNIRDVSFHGLPVREIHIKLDFEKMAMVTTSIDNIVRAVETNNANIPGGDLKLGPTSLSVRSSGSFQDLEEIRNCVVNSYQGRLIYLKDIATVDFGYEEQAYITRFGSKMVDREGRGGQRAVFIGIGQKEGLNVLETSESLMPVIEAFREELPGGVELEVIYNQPVTVKSRIDGFVSNLLQGMLLVALVIFLSLGLRSSMVVALAIPLSLIIGLGFVNISGFGLQQISIAGLVVVLGMLVDNSIVMVENIGRYIGMGHKKREASILAASEIGWPVITATLTTILAFVPIAAMPDEAGDFIMSLPVTIMITLTVSLFIALAFTPVITSRLFKDKVDVVRNPRGFNRLLSWVIEKPFRYTLRLSLKRPLYTLLLALIYLALSSLMFSYVKISFFPKAQQPNLMIQATLPEGSSIDRTDQVARFMESVLDTLPEVHYYATNVGHGNPRIYYNVFTRRHDMRYAEIYVELNSYEEEAFMRTLQKLRDVFDGYPGALIRVKEFEQGPPFDAPVQVYMTGDDLEVLRQVSADVEEIFREQPGAINIENQFVKTNTELLFDINKEKANMLGIPVIEIDRTIRTAVTGIGISKFRDKDGEEYDIVLKMGPGDEFRLEDLDKVYVSSLSGRQIQLKQFVELKMQQVPNSISRYDMERTAEVIADVSPGFTLDEVMEPIMEGLEQYPMPSGYSYHIAGELESRNDAFSGMTNAIIIAIISIFSVLLLQFRSFKQPLIVFVAIPFAFTGMIWALLITGNSFSFTAFVGLTSLVGIVVNNSIILVDYINKLRERGKALDEALQLAAETRLTPIVLTALTTIGGLLPLTLRGGTLWAPMGWTIIGGLLVSTVLTLVIVPVAYKLLERGEGSRRVNSK
ncbi:MAG: efflux RND transporter permease subunit [Bacteroidetes bacterium]|nr:efflux RND transporter permease subunit [Bacteroidota bacterium]